MYLSIKLVILVIQLLVITCLTIAHTEPVLSGHHKPNGAVKCDFRRHPKSGCEPTASRVCDPKLKQCVCRSGYVSVQSTGECLRLRHFNESCVSSVQCRPAGQNTACLAIDGTYRQWRCQCLVGFWYDNNQGHCVERHSYGQQCDSNGQCIAGLICSTNTTAINFINSIDNRTVNVCQCAPDHRYNISAQECQHQSWKACPEGHQWNKHSRRCETSKHYSNRNEIGAGGGGQGGGSRSVVKNTKLIRPSGGYWTQTTGAGNAGNSGNAGTATTVTKDDDTDEKILEIILEVSFLIVCLLAYQACSKACCPDDSDDLDGLDVGTGSGGKASDEESMISQSIQPIIGQPMTQTRTRGRTTAAFKRHQRRVRRVFCKSRSSGGGGGTYGSQLLLPPTTPSTRNPSISSTATGTARSLTPSPVKYKNIIVQLADDGHSPTPSTRAQCYNCRIYKEVYSPHARCKVCRTSTISQGLDADQEYGMTPDGKQLLPLPAYKQKPIRRSEEVGVPPHLKAPYLNNQPFWLK